MYADAALNMIEILLKSLSVLLIFSARAVPDKTFAARVFVTSRKSVKKSFCKYLPSNTNL